MRVACVGHAYIYSMEWNGREKEKERERTVGENIISWYINITYAECLSAGDGSWEIACSYALYISSLQQSPCI